MIASIPIRRNLNKRPCLAPDKRDRFTNLHEHMVSHILSSLPTKEAVRTSILSKAWKTKWISLYDVDIVCEFDYNGNNEKFINFMNNVFASTEYLRSVNLLCRPIRSEAFLIPERKKWISSIQNWISASLRHNLEYFEVLYSNEDIFYPPTLLSKTSLKILTLGPSNDLSSGISLWEPSHGTLYVSSVNCASNLTNMSLNVLSIIHENPSCTTVTFNFPVLKTLAFDQCKWLNVEHVKIYAPALTTFTSRVIIDNDDNYDYTIEVVSPTPRLTTINCTSENFILDGSSIVTASVILEWIEDPEVCKTIGSRVRKLLNKFSSLEELELLGRIMAKEPSIQRHDKLTRLTLNGVDSCACDQLFELLHATPLLKFLSVMRAHICDYCYADALKSVPSCISSQLEEVVIRGFYETAGEYDFVATLLATTNQLKKLTVGVPSGREGIKFFLSVFCSSSTLLEVVNMDQIPY